MLLFILGKPSDLWALGVVLFTMLYGQFPFYDSVPQELFRKIKAAEFNIPKYSVNTLPGCMISINFILLFTTYSDGRVSDSTISLVRHLLNLNPHQRLKANQVIDFVDSVISTRILPKNRSLLKVLNGCRVTAIA